MGEFKKLTVTLSAELAEMVRARVAAGDFASDSELVGEALRAWKERDASLDRALQDVQARIDEALNDSGPSISDKEVARRLGNLHAATMKARGGAA